MKTKQTLLSLLLLILTGLTLTACKTTGDGAQSRVPYTEAHRYFVRNDLNGLPPAKITTQAQFDRCFGMATVMGPDGQPTEIDFTKQFVIAVSTPVTNRATRITPLSLRRGTDGNLTFSYKIKQGKEQTYSIQPLLLIVVDKKYEGSVSLEAK